MSNTSDDRASAGFAAEHGTHRETEGELVLRWKGIRRRFSRVALSVMVGGGLLAGLVTWLNKADGEEASGETGVEAPGDVPSAEPPAAGPAEASATDPTSPTPPLTATCRGEPCAALQVEGTLDMPGGEGVWVRSCFDEPCERRALAAENQQIFAVCRVDDGRAELGDTVWVKAPWNFALAAIPQDQPIRAETTGHSDPQSQEYGWVSAYYLSPRATIDRLPVCGT